MTSSEEYKEVRMTMLITPTNLKYFRVLLFFFQKKNSILNIV